MKKRISTSLMILTLIVILAACNLPSRNSQATTDPNTVFTAAALTVQAKLDENTPIPAAPTTAPAQEEPTQAPSVETTQAPSATAQPSPTATKKPCDVAEFVEDITVPDNTIFPPNTSFTKTWRLKNVGTCTWDTGYALVFDSGASMGAPASIAFPGEVAPGQSIDLSIDLKAPAEPDTYTGNWKLRNSSGVIFGLGDENKAFWVKIKVQDPTSEPFAVTSASFDLIPPVYNGACPFPITFKGKITTNGPGQVTYTYRMENGFVSDPMVINFDSAGEKNLVDYTYPLGVGPGYVWVGKVWLYIDSPNHQDFDKQDFTINCTP